MMLLNPSKITPPVVAHALPRERLHDRLDAASNKRVVLVVGQAAQGKSTLVADYLATQGPPTAWLHLDRSDTDHVNFYLLLVSALTKVFKTLPAARHLATPPVALGPKTGHSRYRERILRLMNDIDNPFNLVIDGMECLPPEAPAVHLIDWLLECLPTDATVYLISRVLPPLRLSRFKVRQEMIQITNSDLAFSEDEVASFFAARQERTVASTDIKAIHQATEGWVGGLVLVAEMAGHAAGKGAPFSLDVILSQAFREDALNFFSEEIFTALPEETQALLIVSALPETIEPHLLDGIVDTHQAAVLFEELVRRNLFIQRVFSAKDRHRYRFHQLFRDFLIARGDHSTAPERQRQNRLRLAENLYREGRVEEAIVFFHQAGRPELVAAAIKKIGTDLVVRGRIADLQLFLSWVPEGRATTDSWLAFYQILCRRLRKGPGDADAFTAVHQGFTENSDTKGMLLSAAYRIESAVFAGVAAEQVLSWISGAQALLSQLRGRRYYAYAKTLLWMQVGFGAIASGGRTRQGIAASEQARRLAERIGDTTLRNNAAVIGAFGHITAGDFHRAAATLLSVDTEIDGTTYPEYRALRNILRLELMLMEGRFTEAEGLVKALRNEIETHDLLFIYPLFIDQVGRLRICQGDLDDAEAQARHLADIVALASNPFLEALSLRSEGIVLYHKGQYPLAAEKLSAASAQFAAHDPEAHHTLMVQALSDVVARHISPRAAPTAHLNIVLSALGLPGDAPYLAEVHLALALAIGDSEAVAPHLEAGFEALLENGAPSFLLLNRSDVIAACLLASPETAAHKAASTVMARVTSPLPPHRVTEILTQLNDGRDDAGSGMPPAAAPASSDYMQIRTLGRFTVCRVNGEEITGRDWGGRKPRSLLKAIIVHGGRDVPRELLVEDLWPESPPEAGHKRFKVTLHRLRKVLEPELRPGHGSRYVHLHDNRLSLDSTQCQVDVARFLDAYKIFTRSRLSADGAAMMAAGHRATDLYQGEFLPEEPYAPWIDIKRNALRDHYLEICHVMGDHYRQQGEIDAAIASFQAIVYTDPGVETAQRTLMSLHLDLGRRGDALRIYEAYREYAESFLGITPEQTTTALYRQITGR